MWQFFWVILQLNYFGKIVISFFCCVILSLRFRLAGVYNLFWLFIFFMPMCRYSRFQSVANLTLHFSDNFGADTSQIHYIGLRGEATQVITSYGIKAWINKRKGSKIVNFACGSADKERCCCNNCIWANAKSIRAQVRTGYWQYRYTCNLFFEMT